MDAWRCAGNGRHCACTAMRAPRRDVHGHCAVACAGNRLNRLVVEHGLGHLPFTEKTVITPTGARRGTQFGDCAQHRCIAASSGASEQKLWATCRGMAFLAQLCVEV